MPDEGMEQTAEAPSEQTSDVTTEQTLEAAPEALEAAAPEGEGAAPEPVVQFQSDEDVRAFLDQHERARSYLEKVKNDGFEAGRQKREAELRRQAASDEQIAAWVQGFAERAGLERPTPEQAAEIAAALDARGDHVWFSKLRGLTTEAVKFIGDGNPDVEAQFQQVFDSYGEDESAWLDATNKLVLAVRDKGAREGVAGLSLEQIPADSNLHKEIQERVRREVETELKARETEANRIDPGPRASNGRSTNGRKVFDLTNPLDVTRAVRAGDLTEEEGRQKLAEIWR